MRLRLRLSLLARMGFALGIILSITLVVASVLALVGAMLGVALLGPLHRGAGAIAGLPRRSTVLPVPPVLVGGAAALGIYAAVEGWPHVRTHTNENPPPPADHSHLCRWHAVPPGLSLPAGRRGRRGAAR